MSIRKLVQESRVNGALFASGPGFWEARPAFWLLLTVVALCLVFVSRALGWAGLIALLGGAWISRRGWRRREGQRLSTK